MDKTLSERQQIELALGKIRSFALDHKLTGEQVETIFEMGSAAHQVLKHLPSPTCSTAAE